MSRAQKELACLLLSSACTTSRFQCNNATPLYQNKLTIHEKRGTDM